MLQGHTSYARPYKSQPVVSQESLVSSLYRSRSHSLPRLGQPRAKPVEDPEQPEPQVVKEQGERLSSERVDQSLEGMNGGREEGSKGDCEEGRNQKTSEDKGLGSSEEEKRGNIEVVMRGSSWEGMKGNSEEETWGSIEEGKRGSSKVLSRVAEK